MARAFCVGCYPRGQRYFERLGSTVSCVFLFGTCGQTGHCGQAPTDRASLGVCLSKGRQEQTESGEKGNTSATTEIKVLAVLLLVCSSQCLGIAARPRRNQPRRNRNEWCAVSKDDRHMSPGPICFSSQSHPTEGETDKKIETWLILPVVICLSQRLSHACPSISTLYCETANGSLNQL